MVEIHQEGVTWNCTDSSIYKLCMFIQKIFGIFILFTAVLIDFLQKNREGPPKKTVSFLEGYSMTSNK